MTDDQPLTCVRCWHAPASRLLVIRWREETLRLLCTGCAPKDEADARGLPNFHGLTVLMVWPEHGTGTQWGVSFGDAASIPQGPVQRYRDLDDARQARREARRGTVVSRETWTGPWGPVPGEEKGND